MTGYLTELGLVEETRGVTFSKAKSGLKLCLQNLEF